MPRAGQRLFDKFTKFFSPLRWAYDLLPEAQKAPIRSFFKDIEEVTGDTPAEFRQTDILAPEQKDLQSLLMGRLQELLSPETQGALGGAAARRFEEQTLPSIAERFTSLGIDPESSSGFGQQVARARESGLGDLLGQQQAQIPSLLMGALMPQFATQMIPGEAGFAKMLAKGLMGAGQQAAAAGGRAFMGSLL